MDKKTKPLTLKQTRFIQFYDGNGVAAARAAGYKGNDNTLAQVARGNLRKPQIRAAIDTREKELLQDKIMNRQQRQIMWSEIIRDNTLPMMVRLRASELLGKSQGDFVSVRRETTEQHRIVYQMLAPDCDR